MAASKHAHRLTTEIDQLSTGQSGDLDKSADGRPSTIFRLSPIGRYAPATRTVPCSKKILISKLKQFRENEWYKAKYYRNIFICLVIEFNTLMTLPNHVWIKVKKKNQFYVTPSIKESFFFSFEFKLKLQHGTVRSTIAKIMCFRECLIYKRKSNFWFFLYSKIKTSPLTSLTEN